MDLEDKEECVIITKRTDFPLPFAPIKRHRDPVGNDKFISCKTTFSGLLVLLLV